VRSSPNSLLPLPACGPIAASITAPVARQITPTTRASGKPDPLGLATRLRIAFLVLRRIGHRDPGAVHQFHVASAPAPTRFRPRAHELTDGVRQTGHHRDGQALPRFAVSAGANALHAQAFRTALRRPTVDRLLARTIGIQRLPREHRQRHRRRVQPLPMLRQVRLRHAEQLWAGKQIEKADRIDPLRASANLLSVLLGMKRGITLSQGWLRGWFGGCLVTNIVPVPVNLPHTFQPLSLARSSPATARHASLLCARRGHLVRGVVRRR
jgi:hypothetical protein